MARKKREWYEGACYHIMARGNRRSAIYRDEEDYRMFMKILTEVKERIVFELHSYCLMTNHYHMEITTFKDPIWKIMKPLMQNYAMWFNHKTGFEGHVFDSRYTSCLITDEVYFLEVSRYIHLNPVKAAMVREPLSYEHSSYRNYVTVGNETETIVDTSRILSFFRHNPKDQYRLFVEGKISHAEHEMLIRKSMKEDEMWLPW